MSQELHPELGNRIKFILDPSGAKDRVLGLDGWAMDMKLISTAGSWGVGSAPVMHMFLSEDSREKEVISKYDKGVVECIWKTISLA